MDEIAAFIDHGYELTVRQFRTHFDDRKYHALVWINGDRSSSHNYAAKTPKEAIEGLERYLVEVRAAMGKTDAR